MVVARARPLVLGLGLLVAACSGGDQSEPAGRPGADPDADPDADPSADPGADASEPAVVAGGDSTTTRPVGPPADVELTFVSQNILHGIGCPPETGRCGLDARIDLLTDQLVDAACPELVSLQEANRDVLAALGSHPAEGCGYEIVWDGNDGLDRELVLSRLPVVDSRRLRLAGWFRSAFLVRVATPVGPVDFVTTHLASSDNRACDAELCPSPCDPGGVLRTCQARQVVDWARELALPGSVVVVGGDMNAKFDHPAIELIEQSGFVDSHLAAGRPECDRDTGLECTSGRVSTSMEDMTDPDSRQRRRIDYLFFDTGDADCDVTHRTGPFNAEPADGVLAYPSDHTAVVLGLSCRAPVDRTVEAMEAVLATEPPPDDGSPPVEPDPATAAAITIAYESFFDGSEPDPDVRLANLERADELRNVFMTQLEAAGSLGTETTATVDSISLTSETSAAVIYSIQVLGASVFEGVSGTAVRVDGRWLVSHSTFCSLARQDPSNVPAGC